MSVTMLSSLDLISHVHIVVKLEPMVTKKNENITDNMIFRENRLSNPMVITGYGYYEPRHKVILSV